MGSMNITPYSGALAQAYASGSNEKSSGMTPHSNADLNINDFMQIMVAQMKNQGISGNSADTSKYIQQLLNFTIIQTLQSVRKSNTQDCGIALVGHDVTVSIYDSTAGKMKSVHGIVKAANLNSDGTCTINIGGQNYDVSRVTSVRDYMISSGGGSDSGEPKSSEDSGTAQQSGD